LIAEDNGKLVGALPLRVSRDKIRGLPAQKLSFLSDSTWTTGDLAVPGDNPEVIRLFGDYLIKGRWDIIDLQNVAETPAITALAGIMEKKGIGFSSSDASIFPCVKTDMEWEDFLKNRSTRFKKASRNKINKIKKAGSFEVRRYSSPEEVEWALKRAFEIGQKGWKHANINNSISSTEENRLFYSTLAKSMSPLGGIDIWLLNFEGVDIAFEYHVRSNGNIVALTADFDESYRRLSPGSVIDFHIMREIFRSGDFLYNMGCGESFYKDSWTENALKYKRVLFYRDSTYGKLLGFAEKKVATGLKSLRDKLKKKPEPAASQP
ncbi:MAG: GNAT family N-acetyltransferase, partial [Thermodesulfobacteriota bacterium]